MKKCTYCGKEYPDDATACSIDEQPLTFVGPPQTKTPPAISPTGKEQESFSAQPCDALVAQDLTTRNLVNYKIIGADQMEYGPVSAEQVRQWIGERRVDSETKLQAEGSGEWKQLAEVPEFAEAFPRTGQSTCPNCGEPFEDGFDSCWKCGTGRDGSRPKEWTSLLDNTTKAAEVCPKCGSSNVTLGTLLPSRHSISATFRPAGARISSLSPSAGVDLSTDPSFACLDCGLVWNYLPPDELRKFIAEHCAGSAKEDAYALLSEGGRLESQGDTAGALAKYAAVIEEFPGTGAATDAEVSIRNLNDKSG
jgi:hypothetical protein